MGNCGSDPAKPAAGAQAPVKKEKKERPSGSPKSPSRAKKAATKGRRRNSETVDRETLVGEYFTNCTISASTLTDCTLTQCVLKGRCLLINCTAKDVEVSGTVSVRGGLMEKSTVVEGTGTLSNQGGCRIQSVQGYYGG